MNMAQLSCAHLRRASTTVCTLCEGNHSICSKHPLHSFQRTSHLRLTLLSSHCSGRGGCVFLPLAGGEWYAIPPEIVANSHLCVACLYHRALWVQSARRHWLVKLYSGRGGGSDGNWWLAGVRRGHGHTDATTRPHALAWFQMDSHNVARSGRASTAARRIR